MDKSGYDVEQVQDLFNTNISNGTNFGLDDKGIAHVRKYFDYLKKEGKTINQLSLEKFTTEIEGIGVGASKASKALKGITNIGGKLLGSLASAGLSMAVSAAIGWIVGEIGKIHISAKEAEEALNSFTDSFKEFNSEITAGKKKLPELEKEYWNLADGVDSLGNNVSLTEEQYETYLQTVEDIHELMPSLSTYFNEQGQAIGFVKSEMKGLNDQYKQYEQNQIHERWFTEEDDGHTKMEKVIEGINNQSEEFKQIKNKFGNVVYSAISSEDYKYLSNVLQTKTQDELYDYVEDLINRQNIPINQLGAITNRERELLIALAGSDVIEYDSSLNTPYKLKKDKNGDNAEVLFDYLKDTVKTKKEQLDDNNVNIRNAMTAVAKDSDAYLTLSGTESEDLVNFINSFDFASLAADRGKMSQGDFEGLAAQLIKGVQVEGFSEAFHNVLDDDKISTMSYKEAEKFVDKNLKVIRKAMGWKKDSNEYLNFKATLGFEADDEELFNQASEKTGIPVEKIKELFTKGEIELIANVDFKPSGSGEDGKYTEDEYDKAEADVKNYAEVKNAQTELDTADNKLKSSLKTIENYGTHYGKIVEMVNGTRFITDPKELNELLEALPELKDHLKYTESGWMLEAEAMDGVQKSVLNLQQAYVEAQQILTDSAVQGAMTRMGVIPEELASITSVADAYKLLAQKIPGGITLTVSGDLDTSKMTADGKLTADGILAQLRLSQAQKVMQKTAKLSAESAKEDRKKQIKDLKDQQYLADLQHQFEEINQTLEEFTKQLEILKKAQDDLFESDYIGKLDYINQRYETQNNQVEETQKSLDELLAMQPETAQGWNELATTVENLSTKLFEGKRALIDYQVELSQTLMDALKASGELSNTVLDESLSQYDRNVKILTEGGLGGLQFSLTPVVPQDAVEKQREENKKLAKEEEAYQEKVNEIKKRALDEMKAYEDAERARQLADLTSEASEAMASLNEEFWKAMNMGWSDLKELIEAEGLDVNINWSGISSNSSSEMKRLYADKHGIEIIENPERKEGDKGKGWKYKTADGTEFETIDQAILHNKDLIVSHGYSGKTQLAKDLGLTIETEDDGSNLYKITKSDGTFSQGYSTLEEVKDEFDDVNNNSDSVLKELFCNYYGVTIDKTNPHDWKYTYQGTEKEDIEDVKKLVFKKTGVTSKAKGGTATGDIIVNEEGQESYLGKDGKLHLFKPGAQFFNTDEVIRVFNAEDTAKIRKYTGDKYFNQPVGDLSKVTQLANGNIHAIFPTIAPENASNASSNDTIGELTEKATEEHYSRLSDIQNNALNEQIAMDEQAHVVSEAQKQQHYDSLELAQQTANAITSKEQIADNAEKVIEEKRFSTETETVVTELLNWMKNNPIKAPGLDEDSWEQMISDAQGYLSQLMISGYGNGKIASVGDYGSGLQAAADAAKAQNGYRTNSENKNIFSAYAKEKGWTNTDTQAWCADFVSYVYNIAGYDVHSSSAKDLVSKMKKIDHPVVGATAYFAGEGNTGHVELVTGFTEDGTPIFTGGNVGDDEVKTRTRGGALGYYIPRYATGTKDYGIAGENYKKEYLIDKKTGQWTEVNSPTLIDTNEVDVVGEKASAKIDKPLPMYANGTLGNMDMSSEMPKLTVEQIQKILSTNFANSKLNVAGAAEGIFNAQQSTDVSALAMLAIAAGESGWGTSNLANAKNNYWGWNHYSANGQSAFDRATTFSSNPGEAFTAYGEKLKSAGYSEQSLAEMADKYCPDGQWYGLVSGTMNTIVNTLNDAGLGDMSANIATTASNTTSIRRSFDQQIKDFLSGSWNSESSETYEDILMNVIREGVKTSDAYTQEYLEGFNSLITSQDNYETGYKERYEKLLAAKGTPEFDEIKNDLTEYTRNHVEDVLSASTKMNTAYAKSQYDIISQMYDAAVAHYNKRLSEGASADELKVYADSINVLQDQKNDLSDNYVQAIQDETNQITSVIDRDFRKFDDELSWYDEDESDTGKRYENISKRNEINQRKESSAKEGFAELLNDPKFAKIIELNGGNIEDWFDRDGNISATFEEFMSTHAASELSSDEMAYAKQLVTIGSAYKKEMVEASDAVKDSAEAMADLKVEEYIKYQERLVESLDFDATLSQSLSTAKEGMYDLFRTLRDEKAEMDKELKANMQIDDWLTEDTRRQLFNLDDYEEQMGVINEIEAEAQAEYVKYQNKLADLKEDELYKEEEITAEYNRQLEKLQDRLSVAKADLQLAKDKAAFENALKERDTQIIMGNRVQNVADPERLREAAMKVAESESALENEKTTSAENQDIRNMEATTGMINQEKGAIQNRIDMINGMTEEERKVFADFLEPLQVYKNRILALTKTNPYRIITGDNSNDVFMSRDYSKIEGYSLTQDHSSAVDEIQYLLDNGYYKQGTAEYDVALKTIDILKKQHDDKTTSDAHNYGYDLYDPANSVNWYRYMKMYTDLGYAIQSQERPSVDDIMLEAYEDVANNLPIISGEGEIVVSANKKPHSSTTFSGDGDIGLANGESIGIDELNDYVSQLEKEWEENTISITPSSGLFEDYEEVSLAEMISPLLDDPSMAESIAQSIVSGAIAPNIDTIASVFSRAQALDLIKNGNNDNSIHMQNVNVTLEKPVADPNDFVQQLISKVNSEYSTTNNQR